MLVACACILSLAAILAIVWAVRVQSNANEKRRMREYLGRMESEANPD